jgi:hypothetical protein
MLVLVRAMAAIFAAAGLVIAATSAASAGDPSRFFGKYQGEVVTSVSAKSSEVGTKRQSTVEIKPSPDNGFLVYWTTEFLERPAGPDQIRASSIHFLPTTNPDIWRSANTGDPLYGQALIWAQVLNGSLNVYITIIPKEGYPVMAIYRRSLNGADMTLEYEKISDGKRQTVVSGTLKKVKS